MYIYIYIYVYIYIMCGILFTNINIKNLEYVINYLKYRGPDFTNQKIINNYNFIHCLLSMTGEFRPQPFIKDDIICLFNGEIYNYDEFGNYNTDGECLIPLYEKYGTDFVKKLDGEFSLILVDFKNDLLIFSTDIFSIKPLWLSIENDKIGISSYESCLRRLNFSNPKQLEPNKTHIYKLSKLEKIEEKIVYKFCLKQYKNNYSDWITAFEKSIYKRTRNIKHGLFIGLSAGYDSGAIACELLKQKNDFSAYTILGSEDENIIKSRCKDIKKSNIINLSKEQFIESRDYLHKNSESYFFKIENGEKENYIRLLLKIEKNKKELDNNLKHLSYKLKHGSTRKNDNFCILCNNYECEWKSKGSGAIRRNLQDFIIGDTKKLNIVLKQLKYRSHGQNVRDDNGSIGMSYICSKAKKKNN